MIYTERSLRRLPEQPLPETHESPLILFAERSTPSPAALAVRCRGVVGRPGAGAGPKCTSASFDEYSFALLILSMPRTTRYSAPANPRIARRSAPSAGSAICL